MAPTISLSNDGKITGTTSEMEFKLSSDAVWVKVSGIEITGFTAGTYKVSYAAEEGNNAGESIDIVVPPYVVPNQNQTPPTTY